MIHLSETLWLEMEFLKNNERERHNAGVLTNVRFVFHEVRVPFNSLRFENA